MASDTGALLAYDITSQLQCWVRKLEGVGNIGSITAGTRSEVLFVLGTDKFVVIDQLTGSKPKSRISVTSFCTPPRHLAFSLPCLAPMASSVLGAWSGTRLCRSGREPHHPNPRV